MATSGQYVASGGADDKVFIFDMLKRQELSLLNHQMGTVTTMAFAPDTTHLFTGGDDGAMLAYSTASWDVHKRWPKAHKGNALTQIRIHPSGKLAVTLGTELNMQMWNLIRGTCVNTTNLKNVQELGRIVDCLEWSPTGDMLTITGAKVVQLWNTKTAVCERTYNTPARPTCVTWLNETHFIVGLENGEVLILDSSTAEPVEGTPIRAHEKRVKGVSNQGNYLATISSDGDVTLWKLDELYQELAKVATTNIGCRPTCVALIDNAVYGALKAETDKIDDIVELGQVTPIKRGRLNRGNVEIIEEDDDEQMEPPKKKKNSNASVGQFVRAPVKTVVSGKAAKDTGKNKLNKSLSSIDSTGNRKKKNKSKKKLNKTLS